MRVGVLAPIAHRFPPSGYGPWERVAFDLVEGLVELGHEVAVFAPEGSATSGSLFPTVPRPLDEGEPPEARLWETLHVARAMNRAIELDLDAVHSHLHVHALGYGPLLPMPLVSTLHGAAWHEPHRPLLTEFRSLPFVSLSDSERRFLPELNWVATVGNGIQTADYPVSLRPGDGLAFVGRLAPEKAPDLAIEVARRVGVSLTLAGTVEARHQDFFEARVRPQLGGAMQYAGALTRAEVATLLAGSAALLMPLRWEEPFGLVVIESLACGTPVVAWRRGAMPELVADGETGFLVSGPAEAARAVLRLADIDRHKCRVAAERRFDRLAMARGYAAVYESAATGQVFR